MTAQKSGRISAAKLMKSCDPIWVLCLSKQVWIKIISELFDSVSLFCAVKWTFKFSPDSQEWSPEEEQFPQLFSKSCRVSVPLPGCSGQGWAPPQLDPTSLGGDEEDPSCPSRAQGMGALLGRGIKMTPNPECGTGQQHLLQPWPSAGDSPSPQQVWLSAPFPGGYLLVKSSDLRVWLWNPLIWESGSEIL